MKPLSSRVERDHPRSPPHVATNGARKRSKLLRLATGRLPENFGVLRTSPLRSSKKFASSFGWWHHACGKRQRAKEAQSHACVRHGRTEVLYPAGDVPCPARGIRSLAGSQQGAHGVLRVLRRRRRGFWHLQWA